MAARRRRTAPAPQTSLRPMATSGSFTKIDAKFQRQKERYSLGRGLEVITVIGVCGFLSLVSIIGIARLLPHQVLQLERLEELSTEVNSLESEITLLRERLAYSFSTGSSQEITLRQQGFIQRNQLSIKLVERKKPAVSPKFTAQGE